MGRYPLDEFQPITFTPKGLSDVVDGFDGACSSLQNLVPYPGHRNTWACRPASGAFPGFPGSLSSPGFISVFRNFGSLTFGMIATSRNSGHDEPFIYNRSTASLVTVNNVLSTNVPTSPTVPWVAGSPPTVTDWTPPTIDMVGNAVYVTHPGFSGSGQNFFGLFNMSTPSTPVWVANNLPLAGAIKTFTIVSGGSGYVSGTYTSVPLTGGSGSNATAFIIVTGGVVTFIDIDNRGKSYANTDTGVSASNANLGGSGSGLSVSITSVMVGSIQLASVPNWVVQFYNRAYFGVPAPSSTIYPSVVFTDPLSLDTTNANQALVFGNSDPLPAAAPLGLSNQLGGIISSLMVFQDDDNIWQVTGDASLSNLSINTLNDAVGTACPRAIARTPKGLAFIASDGVRLIDFNANVSDPIGDLQFPFTRSLQGTLHPTVSTACCNGDILRITICQATTNLLLEYWFDIKKGVWSGPHTCGNLCIDLSQGQFMMSTPQDNAVLFGSPTLYEVVTANNYVEFGFQLSWQMQFLLPDAPDMQMHELSEWTLKTSINTFSVVNTPSFTWQILYPQGGSVAGLITYPASVTTAGVLLPQRLDLPAPFDYTLNPQITYAGQSSFLFNVGETMVRRAGKGYLQQTISGT